MCVIICLFAGPPTTPASSPNLCSGDLSQKPSRKSPQEGLKSLGWRVGTSVLKSVSGVWGGQGHVNQTLSHSRFFPLELHDQAKHPCLSYTVFPGVLFEHICTANERYAWNFLKRKATALAFHSTSVHRASTFLFHCPLRQPCEVSKQTLSLPIRKQTRKVEDCVQTYGSQSSLCWVEPRLLGSRVWLSWIPFVFPNPTLSPSPFSGHKSFWVNMRRLFLKQVQECKHFPLGSEYTLFPR